MSDNKIEIDFRNALHGIHGAKDHKELEAKENYVTGVLRHRYYDPTYNDAFEILIKAIESQKGHLERWAKITVLVSLCKKANDLAKKIKHP